LSKFLYLRDRFFLAACALYAVNRLLIKPLAPGSFFGCWGSDLLLIPCAAPVCLWLERRCGVRRHDEPPRAGEILFLVVLWSGLFELIAPHVIPRATGDGLDVLAYAAGGLVAWLWWNRATIRPSRASSAQPR
jgi:hypothetical protein